MKSTVFSKVFFDPGYLPVDDVVKLVGDYQCLKLIRHRNKDLGLYQARNLEIHGYPDYESERLTRTLGGDVEEVWSKIINDHQTSLLFDRSAKFASEAFKFNELLMMCCAYQNWLEIERPDIILFTATPHNIKTWVLSRVAESIGVPVLFFQVSFFPWRQFLLEGLKKDARIIFPAIGGASPVDRQLYEGYVHKKRGSLEDAMPAYEVDRLKENNWRLLGFRKELKGFLKSPKKSIEKIKSYIEYKNLSMEIHGIRYVSFFLHYQPERTSIPEGYGFGVQLAAILALQQSLPKDTYLIVKEHPSTYTYNFSTKYRNRNFYQLISSIDRVIMSSISVDPYSIIDNSIATASITGTVIGEAFVRGKPCIAFGAGPMQAVNSPYFHRYRSIEGLRGFLAGLNDFGHNDSDGYFESVCNSSFSGATAFHSHYEEKMRVNYLSASAINGIEQLLGGRLNIGHAVGVTADRACHDIS